MAINQVNTVDEEQNYFFLDNQSSILRTVETNNNTINAVNKIVKKPKKGDIMCITRYKENDVLLEANKQKVVWIDGLSINLKQLSPLYEAVGICLNVKGNKALVRYKTEKSLQWLIGERWELPNLSIMTDGAEHTLQVPLCGYVIDNPLILTAKDTTSRKAFVDKLNNWFLANANNCTIKGTNILLNFSAELVELNNDLPAVDTTDTKDGNSYRNRIIVNSRFHSSQGWMTFKIEEIGSGTKSNAKFIKNVKYTYYKNNEFKISLDRCGCCYAKYYDFIHGLSQTSPSTPMTSIDKVPGGLWSGEVPVHLVDFNENVNCQILRDNFSSYEEYIKSKLIKCPCNAGGVITEEPCGKENTYKLANCTFLNNQTSKQEILYTAANYAASIDLNAPKLGKGNWWLPSAAEMVEIMRDITYGTSFWDTNPDIINRVLTKLNSVDSNWSILSTSTDRWTSTIYHVTSAYEYCYMGCIGSFINSKRNAKRVTPITVYEF